MADRAFALEKPAVYAGLGVRPGGNQPVFLRPVPLVELPAKDVFIKLHGALAIVGRDFKMNYAGQGDLLSIRITLIGEILNFPAHGGPAANDARRERRSIERHPPGCTG